MSVTEKVKQDGAIEKIKNGILLCEQIIQKAEKYERLQHNADWLGVLEDGKVLVDLHNREIMIAINEMDQPDEKGNPRNVIQKLQTMDFITQHTIRRTQLEEGLREPGRMIQAAALAREKLPLLQQQLSELMGGTNA